MVDEDQLLLNLATNLQWLKDKRGWSVSEIAERSGVKASDVKQMLAAKKTPSLIAAYRVADALNVSVDYLSGRINWRQVSDRSP